MMLQLLIRKPEAPKLPQDQFALWMLPITHRQLLIMHNARLETVLSKVEESLMAQISLRKLRGVGQKMLEAGDVVFESSTGVYWLLDEARAYWIALNEPYWLDLRPLTEGWVERQ